jgi:hypothetical protein
MALSGPNWVSQFPTQSSISALEPDFRGKVQAFVAALAAAGAHVHVSATRRPRQRAYMMHWSWCIWKGWQGTTPMSATAFVPQAGEASVDIEWVHKTPQGNVDLAKSKSAAHAMAVGFQLTNLHVPPALTSNHIQGKALDMNISWSGELSIKDKDGNVVKISSAPRDGTNAELIKVGKSYGVIHLVNVMADPPHWSWNGH